MIGNLARRGTWLSSAGGHAGRNPRTETKPSDRNKREVEDETESEGDDTKAAGLRYGRGDAGRCLPCGSVHRRRGHALRHPPALRRIWLCVCPAVCAMVRLRRALRALPEP